MSVSNFLSSKRAKAVILVALIFSIYTHSLFNQFSYDDGGLFLEVKALHGLSLEHLSLVFTSVPDKMEYLPIRDLTYMIDYSVWGDNAFGYHFSNVLLYVFLVLILYKLLSELFALWGMENVWAPFLASVLFVVNPLHVEVVASISQRKDLVMGIFYLLSIMLFVRFRKQGRKGFYIASLGTTVMALLSKGTAVSLPLAVMFADWILAKQERSSFWHYIFRAVPFFIITGIITTLNIYIIQSAGFLPPPLFGGMTERLSLSAISIFSYLKMLVWPYPLTVWHEVNFAASVSDAQTLGAFAGCLILTAIIVLMRRKLPYISFSTGWYLITLAPVLSVASSNYLLFERYMLLPSIAFCILLSVILLRLFESKFKLLKIISAIAGTSIIAVYIIITIVQVPVWKNNITLWDHAFKYNPYDTEIYTRLAKQFFINNRYNEAFQILERARQINPVLPDADFYHALYDYKQGDFKSALIKLNGMQQRFGMDYVDVYCLYGQIYSKQGKTEKAIKSYEKALSSNLTLYAPVCSKGEAARLLTLIR